MRRRRFVPTPSWRAVPIAALALALLFGAPALAGEAEPSIPVVEPSTPSEPDPLFDDDEAFFEESGAGGYPDPVERANRGILRFNEGADRWVFDPITRAYRWAVPAPARRAIYRFFLNLNSPAVLANDILQLEWADSGVTLSRFVINTTVGIAGFFDPAARIGLERHQSDFGQTLQLAGVNSGPYLVIPILGPTTTRDGFGEIVDSFFTPSTYFFGFGFGQQIFAGPLTEQLVYTGTSGLTTRDAHFESLKALRESSVDFYSALRNAFYQNREAEIWDRRAHRNSDWSVPY